jgi:hypothetical protein
VCGNGFIAPIVSVQDSERSQWSVNHPWAGLSRTPTGSRIISQRIIEKKQRLATLIEQKKPPARLAGGFLIVRAWVD